MSDLINLVQGIGVVVLGVGVVMLATAVKSLAVHLKQFGLLLRVEHDKRSTITGLLPTTLQGGYALYIWNGQRWELDSDLSLPGFEASPPQLKGSYQGQVIRKEAVPR